MKRALLLILMIAASAAAGCGTSDPSRTGSSSPASGSGEKVKVAFMYSGPRHDGGWNESFDRSREALEQKLGGEIETTFKENVPEGPQSTPVIESLVRDGYKVIVGTSYGYGEPMIDAARRHPDVYFLQSQWASPGVENLSGFDNAPEDGAYVAGVAMGAVLRPGAKVGWVDAFPIPYDLRTIDGFALGLRRTNPRATVSVVMTNSWNDTNKMGQAARSLSSAGADGMSGSLFGPPVGSVAEKDKLPYVGLAVDGRKFAPNQTIVSTLYDWVAVLEPAVRSVLDGDWSSQYYYVGMKDGAVNLSEFGGPFERLDAQAKAEVEAAHEAIKSGRRAVFEGPLEDDRGNVVVADGERLNAEQLEAVDFVVPGVSGVKAKG